MLCLVVKAILLKILDRSLDRLTHIERSLHTFIRSTANILLWFVTLMVVASSLGINASSLLALVSILGLAVSLAVKDSLSNLAGGLTILGTKPFKVGDYVQIDDIEGTVQDIGLVYTSLTTWDNRRILVPNSTVVDAEVTNYTTEPLRRVDLTITASYGASVEEVKDVIQGVLARHDKVLKGPSPLCPSLLLRGQCPGVCRSGLVPYRGLLGRLLRLAGRIEERLRCGRAVHSLSSDGSDPPKVKNVAQSLPPISSLRSDRRQQDPLSLVCEHWREGSLFVSELET